MKPSSNPIGQTPEQKQGVFQKIDSLLLISSALFLVVFGVWLAITPSGLLGKADAVGYAICHQIEARSFVFPDGRQLPMCARCSGTFLGVLVGFLGPGLLLGRKRAAGFPSLPLLVVLASMSLIWAFDGANSFLHLLPAEGLPRLYSPSNFLRLITGMAHGITMGSLMLPVVNSTLWADVKDSPTLANGWHLLALYGVGTALILMVLSGWAVFMYPLALLSALGAVFILGMVNVVMAATVLRRENASRTLLDALPLILLGLATAVVMVGGIDMARLAFFGTWEGFDLTAYY